MMNLFCKLCYNRKSQHPQRDYLPKDVKTTLLRLFSKKIKVVKLMERLLLNSIILFIYEVLFSYAKEMKLSCVMWLGKVNEIAMCSSY